MSSSLVVSMYFFRELSLSGSPIKDRLKFLTFTLDDALLNAKLTNSESAITVPAPIITPSIVTLYFFPFLFIFL